MFDRDIDLKTNLSRAQYSVATVADRTIEGSPVSASIRHHQQTRPDLRIDAHLDAKALFMDNPDPRLQNTTASGDRPRIAASGSVSFVLSLLAPCWEANCAVQKRKYKPGDEVYLKGAGTRSLDGPYLVSSVTSEGKYILCLENGDKAKDGKEFEENDLEKA